MTDLNWAGLLADEDVEGLWNGLYQLVSRHPAVRPLHFATDGAAVSSQTEINADLAQELFLELFQKQRFDHYIANRYTSTEIENELARIELPNLVGARLRKRYPESFRMARRVSSLLKSSSRFRRMGDHTDDQAEETSPKKRGRGRPPKKGAQPPAANESASVAAIEDEDAIEPLDDINGEELSSSNGNHSAAASNTNGRRRRMVNQVYGLREWRDKKPLKDSGHFVDAVKDVPMRRRDTRMVGRSGSSQLILSNADLENLVVEVLKAIDSPADVRTLRQLVLSKIPLQDYNIASLDEERRAGNDGETLHREAVDCRDTPEDALLRGEKDEDAARLADKFLGSLRRAVNNNNRRYMRLLATLWHCYYDPDGPSQLEIARLLGVSDSLVSDNRRLIEHELKKLRLSLEEGAIFSESLQRLIVQTSYAR
jgi:hypothetical protein